MTVEETFNNLSKKYGDDFNWYMLPLTNKTFVVELKKEIGTESSLYDKDIWAIAKCDSNDDVLYLVNEYGAECRYYIFHLTYSGKYEIGFPKYKEFKTIEDVKDYVEKAFVEEYL